MNHRSALSIPKRIPIFPYHYDENKISDAIKNGNCTNIIKHLFGPLYIDKILKVNMYLGLMYDRGICLSQDYNKALFYYKKSTFASKPILRSRVQEITNLFTQLKEAKRQEAEQLQKERERLQKEKARRQEETRKREIALQQKKEREHQKKLKEQERQEEKLRPMCEKDCRVNKYQYDKSCYKACMHQNGAWWYGQGMLYQ